MITVDEIIKEINDNIIPFEFKLKIDYINHDFIKSIGKDYILAVNEKIREIAEILKKYGIFIVIDFDTDSGDTMLGLWCDDENIDELNNLIDSLTNALYKPTILNIDYELLNGCISIIAHKDKSIHELDYIAFN